MSGPNQATGKSHVTHEFHWILVWFGKFLGYILDDQGVKIHKMNFA